MNIILVIMDSLRKDSCGVYGKGPWGDIQTPHLQTFAEQSLVMTNAWPESLPTLPTRRAIYTGQRVYPFHDADFNLKGDFRGAPGWGPIPEDQPTLSEMLQQQGYRTALISDVYHQFKPSKNFWRGFDQWTFLRGQEQDPSRSGPRLTDEQLAYWLPREMWTEANIRFIQTSIMNIHDRRHEEDYFSPQVFKTAAQWLEENQDASQFFLTVESFDPHEPWLVPAHYRKLYSKEEGQEQVKSGYADCTQLGAKMLARTRANYMGSVTQSDRWFGYFLESMRVLGLLDNTIVFFTSDHGHSIGDRNYMGKRGYPSMPEVFEVPLMVRFPGAEHAGTVSDMFVQHHDLTAAVFEALGMSPPDCLDGKPFLSDALSGNMGTRDHVTVGWGSTPTVITRDWWFNAKCDGTGALLYDRSAGDPCAVNVAAQYPDVVRRSLKMAAEDAVGGYPNWLVELARNEADAPGCSDLAARA